MNNLAVVKVLENTHFRNLWISQLVSQIFLNALVFTQLLRVYDLTHSNIAVSILVLSIGIPNLLLGALAGVFVDRGDKKTIMFFAQFLRVLAILLFVLSPESVLWIYLLMFVIASITQFWDPAERTTIPVLIKGPVLLSANSVYTLTFFSTVIIGNVIAGPLLAIFGHLNSYLVISGAFLVSAFFILRLPGENPLRFILELLVLKNWQTKPRSLREGTLSELKKEFKEGLAALHANHAVRNSVVFLTLSQTLIASLSVMAPGFANRVLKIPATDVSLLVMFPAALGMVVGAIGVGQFFHKTDRKKLVSYGLFAAAISLLLLGQVAKISHFVLIPVALSGFIALVLLGAANALIDVPSNTIMQEETSPEIRSRIYGLLTALVGAAAVFPIIIVGSLSDLIGIEAVMMFLGLVILAVAAINFERKPHYFKNGEDEI